MPHWSPQIFIEHRACIYASMVKEHLHWNSGNKLDNLGYKYACEPVWFSALNSEISKFSISNSTTMGLGVIAKQSFDIFCSFKGIFSIFTDVWLTWSREYLWLIDLTISSQVYFKTLQLDCLQLSVLSSSKF